MYGRRTATLLGVCILAGCATYKGPAAGPTAEIRFSGNAAYAYLDPGNSCSTHKMTNLKKTSVIPAAGQKFYIEHGFDSTGGMFGMKCSPRYSFTPEPGAVYHSNYTLSGGACEARLTRVMPTGEEVPVLDAAPEPPLFMCLI